MAEKTEVTIEQADAWLTALTKHKPEKAPPMFAAHPVDAVFATPLSNGLALQIVTPDGTRATMFINAVLALAIRKAVDICGQDGGWMGAEDEIIVKSPEGPRRWRPQA